MKKGTTNLFIRIKDTYNFVDQRQISIQHDLVLKKNLKKSQRGVNPFSPSKFEHKMAVITSYNIPTHLVLAQLSHGSSASLKLVSHRIVNCHSFPLNCQLCMPHICKLLN